jgi:hypothetical protein
MAHLRSISVVAFLLAAASADAQQITGAIFDITTEEPLAGAVVMLLDADGVLRETILSDTAGYFALRIPESDSLRLRVERYGFRAVQSVGLRLTRRDSLRLEIRMRPAAIDIPGVTATARTNRSRNLEGFLVRQRTGFGNYLGPGEIARLRPRTTLTLLASVPGSPIVAGASGLGILARSRDVREERGMATGTCVPTVYIDGLELEPEPGPTDMWPPPPADWIPPHTQEQGVRVESHVAARTVRAVEVYQRPAHAPQEFQRPLMPECPVVVIWTDYGFGLPMSR